MPVTNYLAHSANAKGGTRSGAAKKNVRRKQDNRKRRGCGTSGLLASRQNRPSKATDADAEDRTKASEQKVALNLPDVLRRGDDVPRDLSGAEIVRFGARQDNHALLIDYRPASTSVIRRLSLRFGDRGIWIEGDGPVTLPILDGAAKCAL